MSQQTTETQNNTKHESSETKKEKRITPLNSIRQHCLWCCCDSMKEVRQCSVTDCKLYPFRMGKNPFQKRRELTDEEKQKITDRLRSSKKHEN
jgi:hypothetical protein